MTVYTKSTGIATDNVDLITKLRDFLVSNGFTLELYADNIISSVNLGKRLHLSKNSVYYNFACSINNSTVSNTPTWTSAGISELAGNCSLTFNSSLDWYVNNPEPDIAAAEIKTNSTYWFYVNDKNIIIVIKYAANKYTFLSLGEADSLTVDKIVYQSSSCQRTLSGGQLVKIPLFKTLKTGFFKGFVYNEESTGDGRVNHFNENINGGPTFYINTSNDNGIVNRSDNVFNGTSILMPIKYYIRSGSLTTPTFTFKKIFIVNFKNHTAEQNLNLGTNSYDVFPFYQKESPQVYTNTQSWGMGLAIKIAE
jgi:hypothetical protein